MTKQSLLFCASEVYPFAKTGGLADVAYALPKELSKSYGVDVVLPLYQSIDRNKFGIKKLSQSCKIKLDGKTHIIELYATVMEGIGYIFVYTPVLCDREFLYGTPSSGYEDNHIRFALLNYAIVDLIRSSKYDIVHCNDWQTALVPLLLDQEKIDGIKTVFTIHNLAFQGIFSYQALQKIGISEKYFTMECLEFYGQINFMKAAICYADLVTTVSPSYAQEILTHEFGCGLEGYLTHYKEKLHGILNGLDIDFFTPKTDLFLSYPFETLTQKNLNKKEFLKKTSLKGIKKPLFVFVGRMTNQKGIELLIEVLEDLGNENCNVAILGDGNEYYTKELLNLTQKYKNIDCRFTYDEKLSHQLYASGDFFLMPSLFEPCGLTQMISMRYGAIAVVHSVGGLKDSVFDYKKFDTNSPKGYGIVFTQPTKEAFLDAITQAFDLYATKKEYNKIVKHNMNCDFSWEESAKLYINLYNQIKG